MNKNDVFEKGILARKIKEHFEKYPNAKSVIIKGRPGDGKKYWRITNEGNSFKIVEVKTNKEEYVLEMEMPKRRIKEAKMPTDLKPETITIFKTDKGFGVYKLSDTTNKIYGGVFTAYEMAKKFAEKEQKRAKDLGIDVPIEDRTMTKESTLKEASSQFANIMRMFSEVIVTMDHAKMSMALKKIQPLVSQITDPKEKQQAGAIVGTLTTAVNSTTNQGPTTQAPLPKTTTQTMTQTSGLPTRSLTTGKTVSGKVVKEADEDKPKKKDIDEPSSIEPESDEDNQGLETNADDTEQEPDMLEPQKSEELTFFDETLKGQTIKASDLKLDVNGGILTLQLVSQNTPFELEWHNSGKVLFKNKGRPYILKND